MRDSDPRPMPPQVLAAYRDPLDLAKLLASSVFTDKERLSVRDELLERLIAKHGNVEVEIGQGSRTLPIRERIAQFKNDAWDSIDMLLSVEDYGGRDAVLRELASVMQPYWANWWESAKWNSSKDTQSHFMAAYAVLGQRQLAWLTAQYARSALDFVMPSRRQVCVDVIESAEAWSLAPTQENKQRAGRASKTVYEVADGTYAAAYSAAIASANAAYAAAGSGTYNAAANAADEASYATAFVGVDFVGDNVAAELRRLCALTKRLITPTLITSASRGLR